MCSAHNIYRLFITKVVSIVVIFFTTTTYGVCAANPDGSGQGQWGPLKIQAGNAWDKLGKSDFSNAGVTIAVIEEGIQANHPEFGSINPSSATDPRSDSHGTSVAGIITARLNNVTSGMSGIAPRIKIKLIPLATCGGNQKYLPNAIDEAVKNPDVRIITINCALTGLGYTLISDSLVKASNRAYEKDPNEKPIFTKGGPILVVTAAGNSEGNADEYYPCAFKDLVLCVGNSTLADPTDPSSADEVHKTSKDGWSDSDCGSIHFSNTGYSVDIYAPGTCIYTTEKGGGYHWVTGTSFAVPHVAGAAAVVWDKLLQLKAPSTNNLPHSQLVKNFLIDNADPFGSNLKRLNLAKAIEAVIDDYNHPPLNTVPNTLMVDEDTPLTINTISVTDDDGNLASTKLSANNGKLIVQLGAATINDGANNSRTLTLSGSEANINAALATLVYKGNENFNGTDILTVRSTDSASTSLTDTDSINITVKEIDDAPQNSVPNYTLEVDEDTPLTINTISVTDDDGNLASTKLSANNGKLIVQLGAATISDGANNSRTLTLSGSEANINAALATLVYKGNENFNGTDILTVRSTDSASTPLEDSDAVNITIKQINDAPMATDNSNSVKEDSSISGNVITDDSGEGVDSDPEGDTLKVKRVQDAFYTPDVPVSLGSGAEVTFQANGSYTYYTKSRFEYLAAGDTARDSFTYQISDGKAVSDYATVIITINGVNDAPETIHASATGDENTSSIVITLVGSDVDGTVDFFVLNSLPSNGSLYTDAGLTTLAATATDYAASNDSLNIYFVPAVNWNGITTFEYVAKDNAGQVDPTAATASLTAKTSVPDQVSNFKPLKPGILCRFFNILCPQKCQGSQFQSFRPSGNRQSGSVLTSIDLRLQVDIHNIHTPLKSKYIPKIKIRANSPTGNIVGSSSLLVPKIPYKSSQPEATVQFRFSPPVNLVPEKVYVIEWIPPNKDKVSITWKLGKDDYNRGNAFDCNGRANTKVDYVFTTYKLK